MKKISGILTLVLISISLLIIISPTAFSQTTGTLTFSMVTTASGGYSPKHLVAIWIENSSGTFIKTKVKYASTSNYDHLGNWTGKSSQNTVDATTGATLTSHGTVSLNWNGTNVAGTQVPDGTYNIWVEMAWASSLTTGKTTTSFAFTKGTSAVHLTPASTTNFSSITIDWVPAGSTPTISTSAITGTGFCAGSTIAVPFTFNGGTFNSGNIFTAELSNSTGSFTSPVNIGAISSATSGTIIGKIPSNPTIGTAYRIRVTASNPVVTGSDNGSNLNVYSITPVTIASNSGVLSSSATTGNQWYEQVSGMITGATNQTYSPTANGDYFTIVTDAHGCIDTSNIVHYISTSINEEFSKSNVRIYPNPTCGKININSKHPLANCKIRVESLTGYLLIEKEIDLSSGFETIDLQGNPNGFYNVILQYNEMELRYRVVLQQ
jgi:hypothetical protein